MCRTWGGDLATTKSSEDIEAVKSVIIAAIGTDRYEAVWLGASDSVEEGDWVWSVDQTAIDDGSGTTFEFW